MAGRLAVRRCVPELLDNLDAEDPRARRSRRDLARINHLMFQPWIMARILRRTCPTPPRIILELGAGDGMFMLNVARRLAPHWRDVRLLLLDRQDLVSPAGRHVFTGLGWQVETVVRDVFDWMRDPGPERFELVVSNLFLHHFSDAELARMMQCIRGVSQTFIATEPRRDRIGLAASRLLWAIGANDVTRHDAAASVRAGFAGEELSALWPREKGDAIEEGIAGPFTHAFAVSRGDNR